MASPFVKWAGGKRGLLPQLAPLLPTRFETYFEPFLGGGAVYFHLRPKSAVLGDVNAELVAAYHAVRDRVDDLIDWLRGQPNDECRFRELRALDPHALDPVVRAGRMIYLNRTCFNGLWRENRAGGFNVPFGNHRRPRICDEPGLRAASRALEGQVVRCRAYSTLIALAEPGDFVFLDPPYDGTFTAYTAAGFGLDAQVQLASAIAGLTARGVKVVMTNSDTPIIRELYGRYTLHELQAPRAIACNGDRRTAAELVVTNREHVASW